MSARASSWLAWALWTLALMSFVVMGVFRFLNSSTPTAVPLITGMESALNGADEIDMPVEVDARIASSWGEGG